MIDSPGLEGIQRRWGVTVRAGATFSRHVRLKAYLLLRQIVRTVRYFWAMMMGDVSGISQAPVMAKSALKIRQKSSVSPILTSRLPSSQEIWDACVRSHDSTGVWPISFSYPKQVRVPTKDQAPTLCPMFPGHKYSFDHESQYLDAYARHLFGLTHKKAGWDCFRHVEIFASGAIPFMPDASLIPTHTMVHYPKVFLREVASHLLREQGTLSAGVIQEVRDYFARHLTTRSMAEYLLKVASPLAPRRILFVDDEVGETPDYQSVLTLIGLKQLLGNRVAVSSPVPYLYSDWSGNSRGLYGRGFGYTKVLSSTQKSAAEASDSFEPWKGWIPDQGDLLVVGSISRNYERAVELLNRFTPSQTVWIHGEDEGPSASDISRYRDFGVTVFARELDPH